MAPDGRKSILKVFLKRKKRLNRVQRLHSFTLQLVEPPPRLSLHLLMPQNNTKHKHLITITTILAQTHTKTCFQTAGFILFYCDIYCISVNKEKQLFKDLILFFSKSNSLSWSPVFPLRQLRFCFLPLVNL